MIASASKGVDDWIVWRSSRASCIVATFSIRRQWKTIPLDYKSESRFCFKSRTLDSPSSRNARRFGGTVRDHECPPMQSCSYITFIRLLTSSSTNSLCASDPDLPSVSVCHVQTRGVDVRGPKSKHLRSVLLKVGLSNERLFGICLFTRGKEGAPTEGRRRPSHPTLFCAEAPILLFCYSVSRNPRRSFSTSSVRSA